MENQDIKYAKYSSLTQIRAITFPHMKKAVSLNTSDSWTFFSNHAHVLLWLYDNPDSVLREVALKVGITERAVQKIVAELETANVLKRTRVGRCNRYAIRKSAKLRHPIESHRSVADLLEFVR